MVGSLGYFISVWDMKNSKHLLVDHFVSHSFFFQRALSQDLKSGHQKCAVGPAQMTNFQRKMKNKTIKGLSTEYLDIYLAKSLRISL